MNESGRRCRACKVVKPAEEFAIRRDRVVGRISICKECDRAKARAYYAANRARKAAYYQANRVEIEATRQAIRAAAVRIYGGACARCGTAKGLEFDHVEGDGGDHRAAESHHRMLRRIVSAGARLDDVDLQLLCAPHHREKTMAEQARGAGGRWAGRAC